MLLEFKNGNTILMSHLNMKMVKRIEDEIECIIYIVLERRKLRLQ